MNNTLALSAEAKECLIELSKQNGCCGEAMQSIEKLDQLADKLLQASSQGPDVYFSETAARTAHSIKRRTQLWNGVYRCLESATSNLAEQQHEFSRAELATRIRKLEEAAVATGDVAGWRNYLLLTDFERIANGERLEEVDIIAARQFLDRINWRGVTESQRVFLDSTSVRELAEYVQPLAITPIDYRTLLADFETIENNALHRCSSTIVSTIQSLRYSDDPNQVQLSDAISTYYRNANLRFAVSADLINRLVPTTPEAVRPVQQNILGAKTTGGSVVQSKLLVSLVPNPKAWQVSLKLNAKIESKTASEKWPAVVHSDSQMKVLSSREILITPEQLKVTQGQASVQSNDQVRKVETDFDDVPLVSDVVHFFVDQQLREQRQSLAELRKTS